MSCSPTSPTEILLMRVTLRASWVHSLKEKRVVIKSLMQRLRNKFNISVGEVGEQDIHQILVIGIAGVCGTSAQVDSTIESIISFIEENTDAEIVRIENAEDMF